MSPLVQEILTGKHDADIQAIVTAALERKKMVAKGNAAVTMQTLGINQDVRLVNLRPQYMVGQIGTIVGKRQTKFVVRLKNPPIQSRFQGEVVVSANCVEAI